ncbi:transglutaminase-like cysteine peptidase [Methylobacterium sp. E-005]|uniref:transglutaminase-like cysteine peptidase n=1 Tax=Methylobacterium sp. E-005 TaxID=2836549 RepID=UPI001FB8FC73|nr:transglutaminase-like cysteine peptidase [Methylobacterium sp. E-005]MCJ2086671.1 transglutaminase-like cysteine peptidase [Methylobacterium sp. E-005]
MRHADVGFTSEAFCSLRWRGWSHATRRARQAASFALIGTILTMSGATTHAHTRLALPGKASMEEPTGAVRAIAGWTEFCGRMPEECTVDPAEPQVIPLTVAVWRTLLSVNRRVNARIRPITDQAHWGVVDRWDFPDDGSGDCEDYQLLKRRMLVERGLPRRALLMTVVIDEINEGHAVLTVRTDQGDFILDNKTDAIRPWRRTGYNFIKRAGQDGPSWVSLEGKDGAAQVATAEP